jgi:ABC-type glutathione transport system ATPase component
MSLITAERVHFGYARGRPVLEDVSLGVGPGETLGLVGESGSGKSTLLRLMLGLARPTAGEIRFEGRRLEPRDRGFMRDFRRKVQVVFQDPYSSLDPRQKVLSIVAEPLRSLRVAGDHRRMVEEAVAVVGLDRDVLGRYPHEFSGGQRQRIAIARAVVSGPSLLLADEAVSALDLSTRVRIVALLKQLSRRMALVFVSHDLGVVAALCDRLAVLERGRIVEVGPTATVIAQPSHPYTARLLASVPRMPQKPAA